MGKSNNTTQKFKEFVEKLVTKHMLYYFQHVPSTDDEIVTILKSHLLIEEQLRKLIHIELVKPEALSDSRLTFHQILSIAEYLHWYKGSEWLWTSIKKINKIRNTLSHELEPKNLKKEIKTLIKLIENECSQRVKKELKNLSNTKLTITIGLVYSYISAYLEACINTKANGQGKK